MKIKFEMLVILVLVVLNVKAQVLKVWKNDSAVNFNVSTQVDSITFNLDSLKLFGAGSDVSYDVNTDLDSVTFSEGVHYGSMTDERDGKVYKTVKIGEQTWMAENLNYGEFLVAYNSMYQDQKGAQKFCYKNDSLNCSREGGLYQWHTAMNLAEVQCGTGLTTCEDEIDSTMHQGICPINWHIPKAVEWNTLEAYLGGEEVAGKKMKLSSFRGDNRSGFSAIATGYRDPEDGFVKTGLTTIFWEVEEYLYNNLYSYYRVLRKADEGLYHYYHWKRGGFSVRCLKD